MSLLAWNCRGLGSPPAVRTLTDEVRMKNSILVFLSETKASLSKMKGFQNKIEYREGIVVPSDGKSGGLAMMWRKGTEIRLKSCSNSHIDVVVEGMADQAPWRATSFYGHPESGKRKISWSLLEALNKQCDMPWVVCGDFNKITQADEKIGWLDRDATQMWEFRECLSKCGLIDLGYVEQRYTWCNGRFGEQRTLVRLDRVVANEAWRCSFSEASVHHLAMSGSDHCMIALYLKRKDLVKPTKRRFMFEAMWTCDERCRQIIKDAWDPLRADTEFQIHEMLKCCQDHLQRWNREVFDNINKTLRVKQQRLQEIEALDMLHETAEEIEGLRKEINEILIKEEVMWSQRSRALWMKCGDRNSKFFHATATQRQRKNRIEGLWGANGQWQEEKKRVEEIILEYFGKIYSTEHPSGYEV
ncbi:uncharacterized protein LOC112025716 [Quercus suber]|uniref:uncharacterized protein LOC112025716 n=1 Tax=Quercus suber TaxID=58331 RepID=UPI0032DE4665